MTNNVAKISASSVGQFVAASGGGAGGAGDCGVYMSPQFTHDVTMPGTIAASDVIVDGVSIKTAIEEIRKRLLIIEPDLAQMEKYAMLKDAYEKYKLIEAMCADNK